MPKIPKGRRVGQAAVNALRTLLEEHDHIVQEISGQNDFGEDLYVTFTDEGAITSDTIKVQVKGGESWRRGNGYAVPVDRHGDTWAEGNIPVYCVVYDPDTKNLYWANATQQLRRFGLFNPPRFIGISPNAVLNDSTMDSFIAQARRYVGRYRGRQAFLTHLGEMSGTEFDPADHVQHFVNGDDDDLIFWKRPGDRLATLLLSARDWEPAWVTLESLMRSEIPIPEELSNSEPDLDLWTAEELELNRSETMWVAACFMSARQADQGPEDGLVERAECSGCPSCTGEEPEEHGRIEADVIHTYVLDRILDRIEAEPDLMQRSIQAMREELDLEPGLVAELGFLETEPRVVRQVNRLSRATTESVEDIEPEAYRLAVLYLIHTIYVGGPSLPLEEQVRIVWRIPESTTSMSREGAQ
ncbi:MULTISPECIES: DUF4365 domain-containing protein [unclassified Streptomyces]|uniref:DUF4365 domain-containing protein n=1 Tax=unclassified Streptomyces TaxID=2593676 RepID=UPI001660889A|nr:MULTISPECIES: DUF4365 domain-containing protein [unclassified Streptomyces]MBD0709098.1 hypothetical protein [Streptomyces sp. CBMA291]MBD0716248.1 hypothetical protein [Streptomyces sp. CBMA370]